MVRRGCAGQLWSRDVVTSTGAVGQLPGKQPHMACFKHVKCIKCQKRISCPKRTHPMKPGFRFLEELTWQASVPLVSSPQSPPCP